MENRILTAENWQQRIRDKIGVDDTVYLPDSVIESPDCITVAEANIIAQVPEYMTIESDTDLRIYLEYAVVLECCILLCPSMSARLPKKESGPHASHELWIDWNKKKTEFKDERDRYIIDIIDTLYPTDDYSSLSHFTVTYPQREW